jgi:hypothetical protein
LLGLLGGIFALLAIVGMPALPPRPAAPPEPRRASDWGWSLVGLFGLLLLIGGFVALYTTS